jgi:type II secretory pathway predicted ATPase ExeA
MTDMIDLYADHFDVVARPFPGLPDPDGVHWAPGHARAYAALEYGLASGASFTVLMGATGTGKTTLLLRLLADAQAPLRPVMLSGIRRDATSAMVWVLRALDMAPVDAGCAATTWHQVQDAVIDIYAQGGRLVLLADAADELSDDVLDELRMLSNLNTADDRLVQIVLAGDPALRDRLLTPRHAALRQRVAAWGHLAPLDLGGLRGMLETRLRRAGADPAAVVVEDALPVLHAATGGVPRLAEQLMELGMVYAITDGCGRVDAAMLRAVIGEGLFVPDGPVIEVAAAAAAPRLAMADAG